MEDLYKPNWAITLKHLRENAGYTQSQIAEKIGVRRERWNQFEKNKARPFADKFELIYKTLGCSKYDFFNVDALFSAEEQQLIDNIIKLIRASNESPSVQLTDFKFKIQQTLNALFSEETQKLFD